MIQGGIYCNGSGQIRGGYPDQRACVGCPLCDGGGTKTIKLGVPGPNAPLDYIETFTGRRFSPLSPDPSAIVIVDIAHALSHQCRFSGHTRYHYSVAQHSVLVAMRCPAEDQKWAALHDGSEGIGYRDIPRPFKRTSYMRGYRRAEKIAMHAIADAFGLPLNESLVTACKLTPPAAQKVNRYARLDILPNRKPAAI